MLITSITKYLYAHTQIDPYLISNATQECNLLNYEKLILMFFGYQIMGCNKSSSHYIMHVRNT